MRFILSLCFIAFPLQAYAGTISYEFSVDNFSVRPSNNGTVDQALATLGVPGETTATVRATFDVAAAPFLYVDRRSSIQKDQYARYTLQSYEVEIGSLVMAFAGTSVSSSAFIQVRDHTTTGIDYVQFQSFGVGPALSNGTTIGFSQTRAWDDDTSTLDGVGIPGATELLNYDLDKEFGFYLSFTGGQGTASPGPQSIYGEIVDARQLPQITPVPLPGGLPMLAAGFALIGFTARRKSLA